VSVAKRRAVSVLLAFVISVGSFLPPGFSQVAYANAVPEYEDCGSRMNDNSKAKIPESIRKNEKGMEINAALYNAYGIVAYGEMSEDKPVGNDFYPGYEEHLTGKLIEGKGRFKNGNQCGEYRFYGFDYSGNLFENPYFKSDYRNGVINYEKKLWIYRPWENLPNWYKYKPSNPGGAYGGSPDIMNDSFSTIRKNISLSLDFSIQKGIIPDKNSGNPLSENFVQSGLKASGEQLANYAVVSSTPGLLTPGVATLFHFNKAAASNVFYISFPLEPLSKTGKEPTPVEGAFKLTGDVGAVPSENVIMTIDLEDKKYLTKDEIEIELPVEGVLKDENYYGDYTKEVQYYTRRDLRDFWFRLSSTDFNHVKEGVAKVENTNPGSTAVCSRRLRDRRHSPRSASFHPRQARDREAARQWLMSFYSCVKIPPHTPVTVGSTMALWKAACPQP